MFKNTRRAGGSTSNIHTQEFTLNLLDHRGAVLRRISFVLLNSRTTNLFHLVLRLVLHATTDLCGFTESVVDSCGVSGVQGIADEDGVLCCPSGCGTCGGTGCDSVPMSWVAPGSTILSIADDIPTDASSSGETKYRLLYRNLKL